MLGVKKQELLTNGIIGAACVLMSVINFFANRDILACILFVFIIAAYVASFIYRCKVKSEPWDELTIKNYADARRLTLFFVEFTLLIWAIICIIGQFQVTIKAHHILFYYGCIKLVQTGSFLYYDSRSVE